MDLIENGVVTGKYKTIHTGKSVFQGLDGITPEETEHSVQNPKVEVHGVEHINDVKLIAAHDNFVSINLRGNGIRYCLPCGKSPEEKGRNVDRHPPSGLQGRVEKRNPGCFPGMKMRN